MRALHETKQWLDKLAFVMGFPCQKMDYVEMYHDTLKTASNEELASAMEPLVKGLVFRDAKGFPSPSCIFKAIEHAKKEREKAHKAIAHEAYQALKFGGRAEIEEFVQKHGHLVTIQNLKILLSHDGAKDGFTAKVLRLLDGDTLQHIGLVHIREDHNAPATEEQKLYWRQRFLTDYGMDLFPNGVDHPPTFGMRSN